MAGKTWSDTMNIMKIEGHKAKIEYDPEMDMFRGEILGLNGGADFYGKTPDELRREFKKSLKVFLDVCKEKEIEPYKEYSGKFNVRLPSELHAEISSRAAAEGKSLNQWIIETLDQIVHTH
jgi:predicted HicB family RNase H-like nuclease